MNTIPKISNFKELKEVFNRIYKGLDKTQLAQFELEMQKLIPSDKSEIFIASGTDNEDNSITISSYVSDPAINHDYLTFDKIMELWLQIVDFDKLKNISECLDILEQTQKDDYEVDYIPVRYNDKINKHTTNFRIIKGYLNEKKRTKKRTLCKM